MELHQIAPTSIHSSSEHVLLGNAQGTPSIADSDVEGERLYAPHHRVERALEWYHIFFISLSGTLGVGLYVQGGSILRLGGPWALMGSFFAMSILAWSVMQGLAEMLCIWPISGAPYEYVKVFVDQEVGQAVGIAYWFTNAGGFITIMLTAAGEIDFWTSNHLIKGILILSVIPIAIFAINTLGVRVYGWIELIGGTLKLLFILAIIATTFAIVAGAGDDKDTGVRKWNGGQYDSSAASNHGIAIIMCLPIAAFAFVGVEITAATALEAKAELRQQNFPTTKLKGPATMIPLVVGTVYCVAAIAIGLAVDPASPSLPSQSWTSLSSRASATNITLSRSDSAFVQAAELSGIRGLSTTITVFIVFTAITAVNTNLYVASRTLFALARETSSWFGYFGKTNETRHVPLRALFVSFLLFVLGYLTFLPSQKGINQLTDILSNMTSGACIMVWGFESFAFLRYYYCIKTHAEKLQAETRFKPCLRRFYTGSPNPGTSNYPWKSHGQPATACFAMFCCLFIILVANNASLWSGFHWQPFLSGFLAPISFVVIVIALKLRHHEYKIWTPWKWKWGVSLIHYDEVSGILWRLQKIRDASIPQPSSDVELGGTVRQ